tara:strand:+ start:11589 stop:11711 length:123 start_codon:yes stop_codon:yes gene_type:complete
MPKSQNKKTASITAAVFVISSLALDCGERGSNTYMFMKFD